MLLEVPPFEVSPSLLPGFIDCRRLESSSDIFPSSLVELFRFLLNDFFDLLSCVSVVSAVTSA